MNMPENLTRFFVLLSAYLVVGMIALLILSMAGWGVLLFMRGASYWVMIGISGTSIALGGPLIVTYFAARNGDKHRQE